MHTQKAGPCVYGDRRKAITKIRQEHAGSEMRREGMKMVGTIKSERVKGLGIT